MKNSAQAPINNIAVGRSKSILVTAYKLSAVT